MTSVRRRSARRPAGPPAGAAAAPTAGVNGSAPQPVDLPGNGAAVTEAVTDEPADAEPLSSLVDDAEVGTDTDPAAPADGADVDESGVAVPATPHVPVKKKGSRRR